MIKKYILPPLIITIFVIVCLVIVNFVLVCNMMHNSKQETSITNNKCKLKEDKLTIKFDNFNIHVDVKSSDAETTMIAQKWQLYVLKTYEGLNVNFNCYKYNDNYYYGYHNKDDPVKTHVFMQAQFYTTIAVFVLLTITILFYLVLLCCCKCYCMKKRKRAGYTPVA
jgi:hypothetical protein